MDMDSKSKLYQHKKIGSLRVNIEEMGSMIRCAGRAKPTMIGFLWLHFLVFWRAEAVLFGLKVCEKEFDIGFKQK